VSATFSPVTQRWLDQGRYVDLDDHRLFVVERGDGPATVLLHGFPTSCYDWRAVIDALVADLGCIAFDFPGYGLSDKPAAYSYSLFQQADVVEALLGSLGVDRANVVSHDMGTSVHTELLARDLEGRLSFSIATSTFLNGSMIKDMATLTSFQRLLEVPADLPEAMDVCEAMVPDYVPALKKLMVRPEMVSDDDATVMTELLQYRDGNRRIPNVYSYVRERYLHMDRWLGALDRTRPPLQLVWASGDPVANEAMGDALGDRLPHARYVKVPDVGHFLPVEDPTTVARHVREITASATR
jgi:pimeloyl-ACP methyl ester carboxylesterase